MASLDTTNQTALEIDAMEKQIRILFVCHGNILKSLRKASKINGFMLQSGTCYTTTTPFLKEP